MWFRKLGELRTKRLSMQAGDIKYLAARGGILAFCRSCGEKETLAAVNAGSGQVKLSLPWKGEAATDALSGKRGRVYNGQAEIWMEAETGVLLTQNDY